MQTLRSTNVAKKFYDICQENLNDADGDFFCSVCGELKKEFLSPWTSKIVLLDCACEQYYKMLKKTFENFEKAKIGKVFYLDLILQHQQAITFEEKEVMLHGSKMQSEISRLETLLSR